MFLPIALILLACVSGGWLAYGTDPAAAAHLGGLSFICLSRQLQWVLIIGSLLPCVALIIRVGLGKDRAWWLLGLGMMLAFYLHRFSPGEDWPVRVLDAAQLPHANAAALETEDEWVVGIEFAGNAYALPYRCLLRTPLVYLTEFDRRLLVIWSPFANSATALEVTWEIRPGDLEVVAMPDNGTLVYNRKYGQFTLGLTGKTPAGPAPTGVEKRVATRRATWIAWRTAHPDTRVLASTAADLARPGMPLAPRYGGPAAAETPVILIHTTPPRALPQAALEQAAINLQADRERLLVFRDLAGVVRAFDRMLPADLAPTFRLSTDRKGVVQLRDDDTGSVWTTAGVCVDGPLKGQKLKPIEADERVYWGVMKTAWPDLTLISSLAPPTTRTNPPRQPPGLKSGPAAQQ